MSDKNIKSLLGNFDELYFDNGAPDPAGDFLGAGISLPFRPSDWWEMRGLWSYPYYSLNLILEGGSGSYRNESGFQCNLRYGNFFLTFPGIKQHYGPGKQERWSELYVGFRGQIFDHYLKQGILQHYLPVWQLDDPAPWMKRFQQLLQAPRPHTRIGTAREVTRFLALLFEMQEQAQPVQASLANSDWFSQACLMLTADMHHKVNLREVAEQLGMSYHTFRLYFTQRAGMPPMQFRDKHRLRAACEWLVSNPHKSCKQIAFTLGYYNGDHFSAHFKRHMGMTPNQYRKRFGGISAPPSGGPVLTG